MNTWKGLPAGSHARIGQVVWPLAGLTYAMLLIVFALRPFEIASANPPPIGEQYYFLWPPDKNLPETFLLQCGDASGNPIFTTTIRCHFDPRDLPPLHGWLCYGDVEGFYELSDQAEACDLKFSLQSMDYRVHYTRPLPVVCDEWEWGKYCEWGFVLSDANKWEAVGSESGIKKVSADAQPGWARFLAALLLAWLVEIPVLLVMARILFRPEVFRLQRLIFLGLLMNLLTLPFLWYTLPLLLNSAVYVPVGEALVILVEAGILKLGLKIDFARALLMSLAANVASFVAGLLLL